MKVKNHGNSCFEFRSKNTKLITNPKGEGVKVNLKRFSPDIVVLSRAEKTNEDDYYLITSPGEYEVKDIFVYGYLSSLEKGEIEQADTYLFDIEDVHLCMIDKSVKSLRASVLDELGIVDVLFVSLAEDSRMKLTKITDLVNKIEPYIVVPMDYTKKTLDDLIKVMGVKEMENEKVLDIKKGDFGDEEAPMRFVVLEK